MSLNALHNIYKLEYSVIVEEGYPYSLNMK